MPFTDEFIVKEKIGCEFLSDINISVCQSCGCTQNISDTQMEDYYFDYTYSVQSSQFALKFMEILATRISKTYFQNKVNPTIIEIGSGSGEQLREFQKLGFQILGIEPSKKLSDFANRNDIKTLNNFFDENIETILQPNLSSVDALITSYTFDHIPNPVGVLKNVYKLLADNGILIIEVHDLDLIIQRNEFCLFEHEHYTYLNKHTMEWLLNSNGFKIETFNILTNAEKRANSLLIVARKNASILPYKLNVSIELTKLQNLNSEIIKSISRIESWLNDNKNNVIVAYGAGGRGIMTIAALNNYEKLAYIIDKNPKSTNIYSPKSHLPVYGIDQLAIQPADKILVFSFGYFNEIIEEITKKYNYKPEQFTSILDLLELKHA